MCILSLQAATEPEDSSPCQKIATVTPGLQSGSENPRPLSLSFTSGEMEECKIKDKIAEHMDKHSLQGKNQCGLWKGKSMLTCSGYVVQDHSCQEVRRSSSEEGNPCPGTGEKAEAAKGVQQNRQDCKKLAQKARKHSNFAQL